MVGFIDLIDQQHATFIGAQRFEQWTWLKKFVGKEDVAEFVQFFNGLGQTLGIFEGTTLALISQEFTYKAPVFFGDTIRLRLTVQSMRASSKGGKGTIVFTSEILKQDDTMVVTGTWTVLFRDRS